MSADDPGRRLVQCDGCLSIAEALIGASGRLLGVAFPGAYPRRGQWLHDGCDGLWVPVDPTLEGGGSR